MASRDYIVEGEFLPEIVSNDDAVASLTASPPLFGYVASSTKPTASTLLRIGPDGDPLLASWQVGLGTATSWTSDAGARWAQSWASWDGYVTFWTNVVRSTFPSPSGDVETRAQVRGDVLSIEVDSAIAFADGAQAVARVTTPGGATIEVPLDRVGGNTFAAELPADQQGVYAVGTSVRPGGARGDAESSETIGGSALAARSYSLEYRPGDPDQATLDRIAELTGGRTDIEPAQAFDEENLTAGSSWFSLVPWLVLFAALAWPLAIALSRIAIRRGATFARDPQAADKNAALAVHRARRGAAVDEPAMASSGGAAARSPSVTMPGESASPPSIAASPVAAPPPTETPAATPASPGASDPAPTSTLDALLARKRPPPEN